MAPRQQTKKTIETGKKKKKKKREYKIAVYKKWVWTAAQTVSGKTRSERGEGWWEEAGIYGLATAKGGLEREREGRKGRK